MTSRSRSVRPCGSFKTTRKKSPPSTKNLPSDTPLECLVIYERINKAEKAPYAIPASHMTELEIVRCLHDARNREERLAGRHEDGFLREQLAKALVSKGVELGALGRPSALSA